jgi:hypothetical protein
MWVWMSITKIASNSSGKSSYIWGKAGAGLVMAKVWYVTVIAV